jgi:hypothetical protein
LTWSSLRDRLLVAPLLPSLGGDLHEPGGVAADTSNFDPFPDDADEDGLHALSRASNVPVGISLGKDPFVDF